MTVSKKKGVFEALLLSRKKSLTTIIICITVSSVPHLLSIDKQRRVYPVVLIKAMIILSLYPLRTVRLATSLQLPLRRTSRIFIPKAWAVRVNGRLKGQRTR